MRSARGARGRHRWIDTDLAVENDIALAILGNRFAPWHARAGLECFERFSEVQGEFWVMFSDPIPPGPHDVLEKILRGVIGKEVSPQRTELRIGHCFRCGATKDCLARGRRDASGE